ncbi:ankyrin repeat domain-containing protein [Weissella ceti]|uniref:Ankyrin repeat domain-containing protein n=1 Tax=Weissella ceti TaxID=759620 RepID=A0ABT3E627_9LACO|nr:ankyrin repeat domain-containing protein [Weissella ceti]MCW0953870.1 ankyrin repeat domain-containing protein [Weissella ceti]QVK12604.1 ankyrin repeat domain-containing protein [Weissella ceti]
MMELSTIANLSVIEFKQAVIQEQAYNLVDDYNGSSLLQLVISQQESDGYQATDIYDKSEFLLMHGANINHQSDDGRTALHDFFFEVPRPTVEHENKIVDLLLSHKIDVNLQDKFGATAFQYAITNNALSTKENETMYTKMLQAGANYTLNDNFNHNILYYCHEFSERKAVLSLIEMYGQYSLSD